MSDATMQLLAMVIIGVLLVGLGIYARQRAATAKTPSEREMWERVAQVTDTVVKSKMAGVAELKVEHGGKLPPVVAAAVNSDAVANIKNDLGPALVAAFEKTLGGEAPASQALARQVEARVVEVKAQPTTTKLESAPGSTVTVTSEPVPPASAAPSSLTGITTGDDQ